MIKGYTTQGSLPPHLVEERGFLIDVQNCASFSDAENRLIAAGNGQASMNYILNVDISGSTGNFTARGEPVKLTPEP